MSKTVEDLNEFVRDCYLDYAAAGIEIGDPAYEWEEAHHPDPKCMGGTVTVPLMKKDHAIHGVFQSEVFQHPCIFGWEADYLEGELYDLCKKWHSIKGNLGGSNSLTFEQRSAIGRKNVESGHLQDISSLGGKAGSASQIASGVGIYGTSIEQRREWLKTARSATNPRAPWWTNGTEDKKCVECPGPEWVRGRSKTRKNRG